MNGKKQQRLDFGAQPPRMKKRKSHGPAVVLDPRRHWVWQPPSDAEVAAVEAMERGKRAGRVE